MQITTEKFQKKVFLNKQGHFELFK